MDAIQSKNASEMKDKNMCNSKRQTSIENLVVKTKKREGGEVIQGSMGFGEYMLH